MLPPQELPTLAPGRATIDDVARLAGVSTATVSRVLNNSGTVAQKTIVRVQEAIQQLNYVAHGGARSLASTRTNTIGLIIPAASTLFFSALMQGINDAASRAGYDLLIHATLRTESTADGNPLRLGPHNSDGLLIFTNSVDEITLKRLADQGFPTVLLHRRPIPGIDIPTIQFNNFKGGYDITSHLIKNAGRRRIAFLRGAADNEDSAQREAGFRVAMAEHGLEVDPRLIGSGLFATEPAKLQIKEWLEHGIDFDAVFAGDDNSAAGVLDALAQANVKVPERVAVVGFNDDVLSRVLNPPLTTVVAPASSLGNKAVDILVDIIRGETVNPETILETDLAIRKSCGSYLLNE